MFRPSERRLATATALVVGSVAFAAVLQAAGGAHATPQGQAAPAAAASSSADSADD